MIIFIDWISTPDHAGFNKAFFEALSLKDAILYVFDDRLRTDALECIKVPDSNGRFKRFQAVRKICKTHRDANIVFLTYDSALLPFLVLLNKKFMTFEHNTVPENGLRSKHGVWQYFFFHNILRMAQFPAQVEALRKIGQNVIYVGSPILADRHPGSKSFNKHARIILVPSYRAELTQIAKVIDLAPDCDLVVKKAILPGYNLNQSLIKHIRAVERIDIDSNLHEILCVAITVTSPIRGTGWFNDALSRGIPVLTTNENATRLFEETFPSFSCVCINEIVSSDEFISCIQSTELFPTIENIYKHNDFVRERFINACNSLGWHIS